MALDRRGDTSAPPQRVLRTLGRVHVPPIVQRHPALRWLAPLAVVGAVGVVATGMFGAQATTESLPEVSAGTLLADAQQPRVNGFSGTVVSRLSLGLPELPSLSQDSGSSSVASLLTGSRTLKVWYGGPSRQRIALLGATDETDVFRSGRQVWQWTSSDRTALHATLATRESEQGTPAVPSTPSTVTPESLADDLLQRIDPTTTITVHGDREIANRSAYEVVLTPKGSITKIGSVRLSLDGATKLPLGVQVYARGSRTPAIDVAYTSINFATPADTSFNFAPPHGAKVRRIDPDKLNDKWTHDDTSRAGGAADPASPSTPGPRSASTGTGWSTVWTLRTGRELHGLSRGPLAEASTRVYGPWGAGRLVTSDLLSVLVTDDGRVLIGAVDANTLFAAAN